MVCFAFYAYVRFWMCWSDVGSTPRPGNPLLFSGRFLDFCHSPVQKDLLGEKHTCPSNRLQWSVEMLLTPPPIII